MLRRGELICKRKHGRNEGKYPKSAQSHEQFAIFCNQWLELSLNRVKPSSYFKYKNTVNNHIIPEIGELGVHDIDYIVIEKMKGKMINKELSPKTIRDILTVLKAIIKHCQRVGVDISDNYIVYPKEINKPIRILSIEEQNKLISYLTEDTDNIKFGILLSLMTGLRIGELCALKWGDISFTDRTISVSKTMQRIPCYDRNNDKKTQVITGSSKSESSVRIIPVTDNIIGICMNFKSDDPDSYVLTGSRMMYIEPRRLQMKFEKITDACGLQDVHFHTLRHTFATRCVEVGFEIKSLSEILGHANSKITLDRYVHSSLDFKRCNMQKLASIGF